MREFFHKRIIDPIVTLLKQGITPQSIALSLACGAIIGIFPVLGTTTILCTAAALALRLNLVAVHTVHFLMTPVQLLLIIPFVRVGEALVDAPQQPVSISAGLALLSHGVFHAVTLLWTAIVHAVVGWLVLGPITLYLVYRLLRPVLTRAAERVALRSRAAPQTLQSAP